MAEVGGLLYVLYIFGGLIMFYYANWASTSLLSSLMVRFTPMEERKGEKEAK